MKKRFLVVLFLVSSQLFLGQNKPNVLLLMADDLNDYIGFLEGHPSVKTPNMDRLAASGIQFVNAHTNVPICQPSRNSLFTGVYPHDSEDFGWTDLTKQAVLKHNKTMMEFFVENGYQTLGTGKLTHGSPKKHWQEWGNNPKHNYGPFYYDGNRIGVLPTVPDPYRQIGTIDGSYGRISDGGTSAGTRKEKGLVYGWDMKPFKFINRKKRDLLQGELHAQWAIDKLNQFANTNNDKPFFMGIGFVRPHTPLHAPDEYFDMYPLDEIELNKWLKEDELDTFWKENFQGDLKLDGEIKEVYDYRGGNLKGPLLLKTLVDSYKGNRDLALKHFLQAYLACITFVDHQIGKILDTLESTGLEEKTIVILTSDHGWHMGEKGHLFKNSPWEESTRIPYIIRVPESGVTGKVSHPVSLIDIYPTLIDYCVLEGNTKKSDFGGELGGYSLRAFLENPTTKKWKGPEYALTVIGNYGLEYPKEKQNYAMRTLDYRYIRYSNGKEELYHNTVDPNEWYNLVSEKRYQKKLKSFRKKLKQILD